MGLNCEVVRYEVECEVSTVDLYTLRACGSASGSQPRQAPEVFDLESGGIDIPSSRQVLIKRQSYAGLGNATESAYWKGDLCQDHNFEALGASTGLNINTAGPNASKVSPSQHGTKIAAHFRRCNVDPSP